MQPRKPTSFLTQCCVWEASVQNQLRPWESKIKWCVESRYFRELDRIDGDPMEFEWTNSQDTTLGIHSRQDVLKMTELKCEPEHFQGRIIFMSMYNHIVWRERRNTGKRGNKESCIANAHRVKEDARRFTRGHRSFPGSGSEKKWHATHVCKPDGQCDEVAENMMINFVEIGNPTFRASSALERGELKSKEMRSIQFNGSDETIELILRTVISINQLTIYGAVADPFGELARDSKGTWRPGAPEDLESMVIPTECPRANQIRQTDAEVHGNWLREYEQKFVDLPKQEKLTKLCSNAGFSKNIEKGQLLITLDDDTLDDDTLDEMMGSCREYTLPRSDESSEVKVWIRGITKIGPVLEVMVFHHQGRYGVEIKIESLFRDRTCSLVCIVNGINKYVNETSEEILVASVEERSTGQPVAKAEPRPTPTLTLSPVSIPHNERKWIDIEPGKFNQGWFACQN